MMRRAALIVAAAALVGCPAEQSAGSATTSASAVVTSIPTPAASVSARRFPSPYADEDLAVPEDFEAQAEKDITSENYKAILDEMDTDGASKNADIPPAASAAPGKIPAPPP